MVLDWKGGKWTKKNGGMAMECEPMPNLPLMSCEVGILGVLIEGL